MILLLRFLLQPLTDFRRLEDDAAKLILVPTPVVNFSAHVSGDVSRHYLAM